jgi:glucose-1-phosphate cytidylyltransferase
VLSTKVFNRIKDDLTIWESESINSLANDGQLTAYKHDGFWQPMDTLREKIYLEKLWNNGEAR